MRDSNNAGKQIKAGNSQYRDQRNASAIGSSSRAPQGQAKDIDAAPSDAAQQKPLQNGPARVGESLDSTSAAAHYSRGNAYSSEKQYDLAIQEYSQAIRLEPNSDAAFYARGNAYYGAKDYDRAVQEYSQAIRLKPNFENAFMARGNAYSAEKDYDHAIQDYTQAIRLKPNFENAFYNRSNAYRAKGDLNRANQDYDEASRLKAGSLPAPGANVAGQLQVTPLTNVGVAAGESLNKRTQDLTKGDPDGGGSGQGEPHNAREDVFKVGGGVGQPAVIFKVDPEYSEEARRANYSGAVLLSIVVGADGQAHDIHVVKGAGMGLDEKAIEAVQKWRFRPGMKGGQAVNVRATIEMNFRL